MRTILVLPDTNLDISHWNDRAPQNAAQSSTCWQHRCLGLYCSSSGSEQFHPGGRSCWWVWYACDLCFPSHTSLEIEHKTSTAEEDLSKSTHLHSERTPSLNFFTSRAWSSQGVSPMCKEHYWVPLHAWVLFLFCPESLSWTPWLQLMPRIAAVPPAKNTAAAASAAAAVFQTESAPACRRRCHEIYITCNYAQC